MLDDSQSLLEHVHMQSVLQAFVKMKSRWTKASDEAVKLESWKLACSIPGGRRDKCRVDRCLHSQRLIVKDIALEVDLKLVNVVLLQGGDVKFGCGHPEERSHDMLDGVLKLERVARAQRTDLGVPGRKGDECEKHGQGASKGP
ncbi:hypothetical protein STEG23_015405 [Scotinomys teguina]